MKTVQSIALFLFTTTILILPSQCRSRGNEDAVAPPVQRTYKDIPLSDGAIGPESIAFDCEGTGPYVGVSDGRILKWHASKESATPTWNVFAYTSPNWTRRCSEAYDEGERLCGRPLGLRFDKRTCNLYIADAYYGLMVVGSQGGRARSLAKSANGVTFEFTNALDIDEDAGVIYFTDSSTRFQRWQFFSIVSTKDRTGRLMKYDMRTRSVEVLLTNLSFANGVALSKRRDFVLITETTLGRVRRFWLTGPKSRTSDVFIQLKACPDNINSNQNGDFWIAQVPPQFFLLSPFSGSSESGDGGSAVKVSEDGNVLDVLDDNRNDNVITTSDVQEFGGKLWIGSVVDDYIEITNS